MKICVKCKALNEDEAVECKLCGGEVEEIRPVEVFLDECAG